MNGDTEKVVVVQAGRMRGVVLSYDRYAELLAGQEAAA